MPLPVQCRSFQRQVGNRELSIVCWVYLLKPVDRNTQSNTPSPCFLPFVPNNTKLHVLAICRLKLCFILTISALWQTSGLVFGGTVINDSSLTAFLGSCIHSIYTIVTWMKHTWWFLGYILFWVCKWWQTFRNENDRLWWRVWFTTTSFGNIVLLNRTLYNEVFYTYNPVHTCIWVEHTVMF